MKTTCPTCRRDVALTSCGRLYPHGSPTCPQRTLGQIWPTKHRGRRVQTIPGPDTWNPTQGAA